MSTRNSVKYAVSRRGWPLYVRGRKWSAWPLGRTSQDAELAVAVPGVGSLEEEDLPFAHQEDVSLRDKFEPLASPHE